MIQRDDALDLNFPACIAEDFPAEYPIASASVEDIIEAVEGADLASLARHVPELATNDWKTYLRCSLARMVHAASSLRGRGVVAGRMLDFGSYFGNFALMFARMGFEVEAMDLYSQYAHGLAGPLDLLAKAGVCVLDSGSPATVAGALPHDAYDAIIFMGVIEHIPHTPRPTLEVLDRALKAGGYLLLDTPNLAYLYNRRRLARGESIMPALAGQYYCLPPFMGHHREYTAEEIVWMLRQIKHDVLAVRAFNYSSYGVGTLRGRDVDDHWAMVADPASRELIMALSRKPLRVGGDADCVAGKPIRADVVFEDPPSYWKRRVHAAASAGPARVDIEDEILAWRVQAEIKRLQGEVDLRDEMLARLQTEFQYEVCRRDEITQQVQREVGIRDEMLARVQAEFQAEVRRRDEMLEAVQREVGVRDEMLARVHADFQAEVRRRDEMLEAVQREVGVRDEMLADLQAAFAREVGLRDRLLEGLQQQVNRLNALLESPAPKGGAESPDPSAPLSPARDERGA